MIRTIARRNRRLTYGRGPPSTPRSILADKFAADVVVISAYSPKDHIARSGAPLEEQWLTNPADAAHTALQNASERAAARGLSVRTEAAEGDAAQVLVRLAEKHGADVIVIGNKGMERRVLGSVPNSVTHKARARCSWSRPRSGVAAGRIAEGLRFVPAGTPTPRALSPGADHAKRQLRRLCRPRTPHVLGRQRHRLAELGDGEHGHGPSLGCNGGGGGGGLPPVRPPPDPKSTGPLTRQARAIGNLPRRACAACGPEPDLPECRPGWGRGCSGCRLPVRRANSRPGRTSALSGPGGGAGRPALRPQPLRLELLLSSRGRPAVGRQPPAPRDRRCLLDQAPDAELSQTLLDVEAARQVEFRRDRAGRQGALLA